jgi:hypothetical protein
MTEKKDAIQRTSDSIETAVRDSGVVAVKGHPAFLQAVRMAHGLRSLRDALPDAFVRENIMPLQGSALGFLTDKDSSEGYPLETVRDVLCEALLRGFRPVGNEFNIISGRFYGARAGFDRIVHEFPGLSHLRVDLGVPVTSNGGALVACVASWTLDGLADSLDCVAPRSADGIDTRIPVRANAGMGTDAILGKAHRKLFARIYQRLTGSSRDVIDADVEELPRRATLAGSAPSATAALAADLLAAPALDGCPVEPPIDPPMGANCQPADPALGPDGVPEPGSEG